MTQEINSDDLRKALTIVKTMLASKGVLDAEKNSELWEWYMGGHGGIGQVLATFEEVFKVQFYKLNTRSYLLPEDDEALFFKSALSYSDITNAQDKNLVRFLTIFLMVLFFSGEGDNFFSRDFITLEDYKNEVDGVCTAIINENGAEGAQYHEDFGKMAHNWFSKYESDSSEYTRKMTMRYGLLTIVALRLESLALVENERINDDNVIGRIMPTQRWIDLAGFVLRKERAQHLHAWLYKLSAEGGEEKHAKN